MKYWQMMCSWPNLPYPSFPPSENSQYTVADFIFVTEVAKIDHNQIITKTEIQFIA